MSNVTGGITWVTINFNSLWSILHAASFNGFSNSFHFLAFFEFASNLLQNI
jgi:hypothetical protein